MSNNVWADHTPASPLDDDTELEYLRGLTSRLIVGYVDARRDTPSKPLSLDKFLKEVQAWAAKQAVEAEKIHFENYAWLLGLADNFPVSKSGSRYNWRSELRQRIPKEMLYRLNALQQGEST